MINRWLSIYLSFLLLTQLFSSIVFANVQDYRYQKAFKVQRLSLAEGLSQSVVNDVIQDQDGYIWLATEDGLNRFDSYEFKVFRHDHQNKHSLHENWVISLLEEPGVGIWVGTVAGLSFYNPEDQTFTNYSTLNNELKTWIRSFHYSNNNVVWIATNNGLFYVDRNQDKVLPFVSSKGKKISDEVTSITESDSNIYVASSECIYQIDKKTHQLSNLCDSLTLAPLKNLELTVLINQNDFLWIGSKTGLFRYNLNEDSIKIYLNDSNDQNSISDNYIQDLVLDTNQALWIATTEGLNFYNTDREIFEHFSKQNFTDEGLSSKDVVSIYIDNQQLLWLGTYGGGVNILDPNQHQFEHLLNNTDVLTIGDNNIIHDIEKDKYGTLWLASYGEGLIKYDLLTGNITRPLNDKNIEYDKFVWTLLIDYSNRLWVASLEELIIIDIEKNTELKVQFTIDGIPTDDITHVNRLYEDQQGKIWIASQYGLFKVTSTQEIDNILHIDLTNLTSQLPTSFTSYQTAISTIIQDQDGNFWLGGSAGLLYYKVEQDEWKHLYYDDRNPQSLSNDNIQVIFEDSHGFLWVGTADGLNRLVRSEIDSDTFYFERITTYEGLPNNTIYGILEDENKQLWISTNQGLVKYANTSSRMDIFRSADGISSDEFNLGAYFSDSEGRLYFGSINGITIVNNISAITQQVHKRILFTKVQVGDRKIEPYFLNHSLQPSITQHSDEPTIEVAVANINFSKLGTQRYRYRIGGFDDKWKYLGVTRNLFIAGLQEGVYQLELQSQLTGQSWLGQGNNLNIIVETSFWNSNQAYLLVGIILLLLFASIIFLLAHFYKNKIDKTKKKVNIELLRIRELRSDNAYLKREIDSKESEVIALNKKIHSIEKKIGIEKYRDATTGFYKLSYLFKIDEQNAENTTSENDVLDFDCYKSMAIFELINYSKIYERMGPLAAAELVSKISISIRQKMDAGTEILCIQNAMFLVLNNESDYKLFEGNMSNLRHQIVRSQYDIANGLSGNTEVSLTLFDVSALGVKTKIEFISMVNLLIHSHREMPAKYLGKSVQFIMNKKVREFGAENISRSFVDLQKNNIISIKEI